MHNREKKSSLISVLSLIVFLSSLMALWFYSYNYFSNLPKDIESFTYSQNILEFKIKNDDKLYKLKLPSFAKISDSDKLGINMKKSHIAGENPNPKVHSNPRFVDKKIELYINDKLSYNTNNNLELSYVFKDPDTGLIVEKEFK